MGSYAVLNVLGGTVLYSKSHVPPELIIIFRDGDKRVSPVTHGEETNYEVCYRISAAKLAARLDAMGFTMERVRKHFSEQVDLTVKSLIDDFEREESHPEVQFFKEYGYDLWESGLRNHLRNSLPQSNEAVPYQKRYDSVEAFIRYDDKEEFHLGFPFRGDVKLFVRATLACVPPDVDVTLDISDLVSSGYIDENENLVADAIEQISEDYLVGAKVIVLTEGSSDSRILRRTMRLLYPHLIEYYSFLNFETANVRGGAPSLVDIVKSFIGSGIVNRTIALFDNDAAAISHMKQLTNIRKVPSNIRITRLPDIEIAENYPTFGPQGQQIQNVNGLAAGIELYFGRDLLTQADGELIPVQWINFEHGIDKYHGVVREKQALHDRYEKKLQECESNEALIEQRDFLAMKSVCKHIFSAFIK